MGNCANIRKLAGASTNSAFYKKAGERGLKDGWLPHLLDAAEITKDVWNQMPKSIFQNCFLKSEILPPESHYYILEISPTKTSKSNQMGKITASSNDKPDEIFSAMKDLNIEVQESISSVKSSCVKELQNIAADRIALKIPH